MFDVPDVGPLSDRIFVPGLVLTKVVYFLVDGSLPPSRVELRGTRGDSAHDEAAEGVDGVAVLFLMLAVGVSKPSRHSPI